MIIDLSREAGTLAIVRNEGESISVSNHSYCAGFVTVLKLMYFQVLSMLFRSIKVSFKSCYTLSFIAAQEAHL